MTTQALRKFVCTLTLAAFLLPFLPSMADAQSAGATTALNSPAYDVSKEIKVDGTIDKIENNATGGPMGTHLLVITAQGVVDVHLGASLAVSAKNLGLSVGQSIHVTGMMTSVSGNSVLLARILTTSDHIYVLRNEHGAPARSLMPRSAAAANSQKGGL